MGVVWCEVREVFFGGGEVLEGAVGGEVLEGVREEVLWRVLSKNKNPTLRMWGTIRSHDHRQGPLQMAFQAHKEHDSNEPLVG